MPLDSSLLRLASGLLWPLVALGCAHAEPRLPRTSPVAALAPPESAFAQALRGFRLAESHHQWLPGECERLAKLFAQGRMEIPEIRGISLYNEGILWSRCGRSSLAKARLLEASESEPRARRLLVRLVLSEGNGENLTQARHLLLGGPDLSAEDAELLVESYRRQANNPARLALAEEASQQVIDKFHTSARLHNQRGVLLVAQQRWGEGEASFVEALRLDPALFDAWMNLGALRIDARRATDAAQAYEAALRLRRDDYDAHLGLALALRLRGMAPQEPPQRSLLIASQVLLERAIELAPERPEAYFNEAVLLEVFSDLFPPTSPLELSLPMQKIVLLLQKFLELSGTTSGQAAQREYASQKIRDLTCPNCDWQEPIPELPYPSFRDWTPGLSR